MERKLQVNIGLDTDGVLVRLDNFQIEKGIKFFKREPEHPEKYELEEIFGCSRLERNVFWALNFHSYCEKEPEPEVDETMNIWNKKGYGLHNITGRAYIAEEGPLANISRKWYQEWLENYKLSLPFSGKSVYCSEKYSARDKAMACRRLNINYMVEDKPNNIDAIIELCPDIIVFCYDAFYNQDYKCDGKRIIRINNLKEVANHIEKIEEIKRQQLEQKDEIPYFKNGKFKLIRQEQFDNLTKEQLYEYRNYLAQYYRQLPYDEAKTEHEKKNYRIVRKYIMPIYRILQKPYVVNPEKVPYQDGIIYTMNHRNHWDQMALTYAIGHKEISILASCTLLTDNSFLGKTRTKLIYEKGIGLEFVDRTSNMSKAKGLGNLTKKATHDVNIGIFPEGTRNRDKDIFLLPFLEGADMIAANAGSPIIPLGKFKGKHRDYITVGDPIYINPWDDLKSFPEKLQKITADLIHESEYQYYKKYKY